MGSDEPVLGDPVEVEYRQQFLEIRIGADRGISYGSCGSLR
ncbi:hypothetical protein [Mycobacterium interjectum]|nr:hypothetical protein [Mycobacterium interjectum]